MKKRLKNINFKALILFCLLLLTPHISKAVIIDDLVYNLDSATQTAEVGINKNIRVEVNIPSQIVYDGVTYTVTSICKSAFAEQNNYIPSITLPATIKSIGSQAFNGYIQAIEVDKNNPYYSSINGVLYNKDQSILLRRPIWHNDIDFVIPNSVNTIGEEAFYKCTGLKSITIPNSVKTICNYAFSGCQHVTSLILPNTITSIGDEAFSYCSELPSFTIPESVNHLGKRLFRGCYNLKGIDVDENNPYFCSLDGVVFNKDKSTILIYPYRKEGTEYSIPNSVTKIGDGAFDFCLLLTEVSIPNSVIEIGDSAFYYCDKITNITIPNSVTSIGDFAFYGCGMESVTISDAVSTISVAAFGYCSNLKSITFGKSITYIGEGAFYYCASLTSLNIPNSVEIIDRYAFGHCISLTDVNISTSVNTIREYAFTYCQALPQITIPKSVTSMDCRVFDCCISLEKIDVEEGNPNYTSMDGVLFNKDKTFLIQYPAGKKIAEYLIPNSVISIGDGAFFSQSMLTSITIPNSVISIGTLAFRCCLNLDAISVPNSVTTIGYKAFYACVRLSSLTLGNNVTSIGEAAFELCTNLQSIEIPNTITEIKEYTFSSCGSLKNIIIPNSVESIGKSAFSSCYSLQSVILGSSVRSIGEDAFRACVELRRIECLATVPPAAFEDTFDKMTYSNCSLLVPDGSVQAYQDNEIWGKFQINSLSAESVQAEPCVNEDVSVFTISGRILYDRANPNVINSLNPGIYIIRQGNTVKKIAVN